MEMIIVWAFVMVACAGAILLSGSVRRLDQPITSKAPAATPDTDNLRLGFVGYEVIATEAEVDKFLASIGKHGRFKRKGFVHGMQPPPVWFASTGKIESRHLISAIQKCAEGLPGEPRHDYDQQARAFLVAQTAARMQAIQSGAEGKHGSHNDRP